MRAIARCQLIAEGWRCDEQKTVVLALTRATMTLCSRLFAQRYWGPAGEAPEMFLLAMERAGGWHTGWKDLHCRSERLVVSGRRRRER